MPGLNGTGPNRQGPMTGRGMGVCNNAVGAGEGRALGMGRGRGFGAGRGNRFRNWTSLPTNMPADDRIAKMESQISMLQQEITALRQQNENSDHQR